MNSTDNPLESRIVDLIYDADWYISGEHVDEFYMENELEVARSIIAEVRNWCPSD